MLLGNTNLLIEEILRPTPQALEFFDRETESLREYCGSLEILETSGWNGAASWIGLKQYRYSEQRTRARQISHRRPRSLANLKHS